MRELVYYVAVSIDGYIAAPDGSYDAFPVEGDHMAVYLSDFADALPAHVLAALDMHPPGNRFDTVIQGRASYDIARAAGIERPYAHLSEFVATRSETTPPAGVTFTTDALTTVRELKQQEGLQSISAVVEILQESYCPRLTASFSNAILSSLVMVSGCSVMLVPSYRTLSW